jgi:hypothetical protein
MTLKEVERLLGCPPGDYTTQPSYNGLSVAGFDWVCFSTRWRDNGGLIEVLFDRNSSATGARFTPVYPATDQR